MMDASIEQQLFSRRQARERALREQIEADVLTYCLILLAAQAGAGEVEHYALDLAFDSQQMLLPRAARAFLRDVIRDQV